MLALTRTLFKKKPTVYKRVFPWNKKPDTWQPKMRSRAAQEAEMKFQRHDFEEKESRVVGTDMRVGDATPLIPKRRGQKSGKRLPVGFG